MYLKNTNQLTYVLTFAGLTTQQSLTNNQNSKLITKSNNIFSKYNNSLQESKQKLKHVCKEKKKQKKSTYLLLR